MPIWTTPTYVTSGEASSGQFNTETVDNLQYLFDEGPGSTRGARLSRSATFSLTVSGSTPTLVPFDTETWDDGSNASTATGRYTAPAAGRYRVNARTSINGGLSTERFIAGIFVNGVERSRGSDALGNGGRLTVQVTDLVTMNPGDLIDFRVHQVNGAARPLDTGAAVTYMTVEPA